MVCPTLTPIAARSGSQWVDPHQRYHRLANADVAARRNVFLLDDAHERRLEHGVVLVLHGQRQLAAPQGQQRDLFLHGVER